MRVLIAAVVAALVCFSIPADARKYREFKKPVQTQKKAPRRFRLAQPVQRIDPWWRLDARESMRRQNEQADREGLVRMSNAEFEELKTANVLVPLPHDSHVRISRMLRPPYRWVLPHVRDFILDAAVTCGPYQINSATRPKERQAAIIKQYAKGHAGTIEPGPNQSTHLTGATIDVAKMGLRPEVYRCLTELLAEGLREGYLEVINESAVFHVMVFKAYEERRFGVPVQQEAAKPAERLVLAEE